MAETTCKKRSYDAAFKLQVIDYADHNTNRGAARRYGVNERRVREWKKQKDQLESVKGKRKKLEGGGHKAALPDLEDELAEWIDGLRAKNLRITCSNVKSKALELAQVRGKDDFCASRGWIANFLRRNSFSLRRRTTVGQKLPCDLINKVVNFIITTRKLRHHKHYPLSFIGNMDETPLWLDMPGETTITRAGQKSVPIRTTGHDKARFTVVLAAMADGSKLKPYVVFKGVRAVPELTTTRGVVVALSRNGWMNEELTKDWVKRAWGSLNFGRRLLVWDAYKCHIMTSVRSYVDRQTNTDVSVIPGGLTSHLQPADVSWNKPFKMAYKNKYSEWMATGEKTYTPAGNMRAPSKALCLEWVRECWEALPTEVIRKSFRACGISVDVDGANDNEIHCLKDGGVATEARATVTTETARLLSAPDDEAEGDEDPFADLEAEDDDELAENETVLEDC